VRGPTRESRAMLVVLEVPGYLVPVTTRGLRSRDYKLSLVTDPEVMAPGQSSRICKKRRRYAHNHQYPLRLVEWLES
jgi:hypothetical protein